MRFKNICPGYRTALTHALKHTRKVFAELDGCKESEVNFQYPGAEELDIHQPDLFEIKD